MSRSGSTGVEHDPRFAIFLGNLPFGIEDETLRAKFEKCGDIESVRIVRDKKTNAGKGRKILHTVNKDKIKILISGRIPQLVIYFLRSVPFFILLNHKE